MEDEEETIAKNEMVYDPVNREYDARRMKVTNLTENTRITLPRPLKPIREAEIEIRRREYLRVFEKFKKEETKKGKQETNMTEKERKGLDSIKKRVKSGEIVILKTDKSSKLAAMRTDKYLEMGRGTRVKDRKVGRKEIIEREKVLNEHTEMWGRMTKAGEDHEHSDRIRKSRTSKSNNVANFYFMYKDHK